jgi:hypothetical protein
MDLDKRKVILKFPSLKEMIDYNVTIEISNCEVVRSKCLLICELTEAEIELAKMGYNAVIIE